MEQNKKDSFNEHELVRILKYAVKIHSELKTAALNGQVKVYLDKTIRILEFSGVDASEIQYGSIMTRNTSQSPSEEELVQTAVQLALIFPGKVDM